MEGHQGLLLAVGTDRQHFFSIVHLIHAQNTEGFISLDCGLPLKDSPYTEDQTGLIFSSDENFISSGKSSKVQRDERQDYKPYNVLRYFPDGARHCYDISVKQGTNYLVRAVFLYGNYDSRNIMPRFDLYIGPNLWTVVEATEFSLEEEIIHMTKSNSLQICLVKTGPTTPFISSLELRPLRNDIYVTPSGSLKLIQRVGMAIFSNVRYPDDVYDRSWSYSFSPANAVGITAAPNVNLSNQYELPEVIITTAGTPIFSSDSLRIDYGVDNRGDQVYMYLHFAEIQTLEANETREFDIRWPGNISTLAYRPKTLQTDTLVKASSNECKGGPCFVGLVRTKRSTLPPLLNAYEVYTVIELQYSETYSDDVVAIKNIEAAYRLNIISWQGDPCLPREYKWAYIECNYTNNSIPPRIISLDLSDQGLNGIIAPAFQNLTQLQKLDLSSNSLSGEIPEFLANMKSLWTINLSWNNLKGLIPQALGDKENKGLKLNIQGNPKLCLADKCKSSNTKFLIPAVASVAAVLLIVVGIFILFIYKRKKASKVRHRSPITKSTILTKKRRFTYSEVEAVTNNFERVIREGGFGIVYHGYLNDTAEQVAIKVLSHSSTQGYKQFKAEVELLLRVHHTNLVNLVGYCNEEDHLALVYEYAANGDLKQHLSGESSSASLNWASRLRIAVETAQGLEYLHIGCEPPMIHRDVKTTNILLDEHFHAKLADFGLSKSFQIGVESHVSTNVAGTPGYLDPEYYRTNWLTEKSDVYSLGIVMLEIITNQPVIQQVREKPHIAEWVGLMLTKGDITSIMDPNLNGAYDSSSVWKALELAMSCVNPSSGGRPNMSQVISELKECLIYENSKKEGRSDIDSKSSIELSTSFTAEVTPHAR